jgi:uncharacterized protein YukE
VSGLVGMDVEQVEKLGHSLQSQAHAIEQVITAVNHLVAHSQEIWKGHDATQFHEHWNAQHRPALQHVREAVQGLGQSALNNAREQREVSGR